MTDSPGTEAQAALEPWLERDVTADAGALPRAFELDGEIEHATGILSAGRSLLLVGESGVGKSALVMELVRRVSEVQALETLRGARVVQLCVGLRLSRLRKDESLFEAFAALMDALPRLPEPVMPWFRDGDLLHQTGIAAQLDSFCLRQRTPVIVEGRPAAMNAMLEMHGELERHFVSLPLREPDVDRAIAIVGGWAGDANGGGGTAFAPEALAEAVYLTHRFLARTRLPRKAIDLLRATAASAAGTVGPDAVIDRFCRVHHTPRWLVDPGARLDLDALEERFRDAMLGQADAVTAAVSTIALIKAGLSDLRRPFGVFLFVGPTGVGKTHLGQLLAAELFGSPERLVRINMSDFSSPRGAEALFGDPEDYQPANRRGALSQRLMGRPFGVLLLDEFEKAHPAVHDRLLPLIDEGSFVNGAGETVSCRSSIIIATSNAGAEAYRESALGFTTPTDLDTRRSELERRVAEVFRFELLNRFDRVVHFQPLSREEIRELAARELVALEHRPGLRRAGVKLDVDEAVLDWLAARGYDAQYGARFLKRTIERQVTTAVAETMARTGPAGGVIALEVRRGRIRAAPRTARPVRAAGNTARGAAATEGLGPAAIVERARPRLEALAREVAERDRLLSEMAQPEFWDDTARRGPVTERFRELDVATRLAQRHARPLAHLAELHAGEEPVPAALLEEAALALRAWEERERLEGHRRVWLVLSGVDSEPPPREWISRLARMYMAWCRRSELACAPAAFEPRPGDAFSRLALEVEGPGAEHFLEAECGIHRRRRSGGDDARVRVDLVPQGSDGFGVDVRDRALVRGPFGIMAEVEATVSLGHTGQSVTLAGSSRATLAGLVGDLEAAWSMLRTDSPEVARSYGEPGGLAVDPRTGASATLRAAERGQLHSFQQAWETRREPPPRDAPA